MNCQIFPRVEGIALERFRALAKQVMQYQRAGHSSKLEELRDREVNWAQYQSGLNDAREEYEALARVLIDLAKLRWRVEEDRFGIELVAPPDGKGAAVSIADYKFTVKNELALQLREQFSDTAVRKFIRQMEVERKGSKKKPVHLLVADGGELRSRLLEAAEQQGPERLRLLEAAIQPYLQLVEPEACDEFTGHQLSDLWRYFRFTWAIPATNIPGRQLNYLVRDAAHPNHAVIGIAALCNSPLQMRDRDTAIGWTLEAFRERVATILGQQDPHSKLAELIAFLDRCIDRTLAGVEWAHLVLPQEIDNPTEDIIVRLRRRADEFASRREEALRHLYEDTPLVMQELELTNYQEPPVSNDVLALEAKVFGDARRDSARRAMVAKKRAALIARSLQARLVLRRHAAGFAEPATALTVMAREDFSSAVSAALDGIKHIHVGANMLEITTCGSIPPYNHILGGKLVSLLMLSPQVAADYKRRYGAEPAIISSMMKNSRVTPDSRLVFLGTTSLYAYGASQYNRLRLPAGIIAPDQSEIRFEFLGYTGGFGTVQFPEETTRAIKRVLESDKGFRDVNSFFGEGRSPKFRMVRAGMKLLGFDPETVMQHHQRRCILGIQLCPQARDFLLGRSAKLPSYIEHPEQFRDATKAIAAFWRERWLSSRLNYAPSLEALRRTPKWQLSELIPMESDRKESETHEGAEKRLNLSPEHVDPSVSFWQNLARAGNYVCSDELSSKDLDRLHVPTSLESFLATKIKAGFSLILTGNAGDGKTHLLRQLKAELDTADARVDLDATALMNRGQINPVLDNWRSALASMKPYCLAANEYPVHLLRSELRKKNAQERLGASLHQVLSEVERQDQHRLAYGSLSEEEDAREKVLVVDLSLRNPLSADFSQSCLGKLLNDPNLQALAASGKDPNFAWNFQHLSHSTVRERLKTVFDRLIRRGYHCTIRELWILLARLFFGRDSDYSSPILSPSTWYSERLYEVDPRFNLISQLRKDADPARVSHPRWDLLLEDADGTLPDDWLVDGVVPALDRRELETARGTANFAALKRRFFFEHNQGHQSFALEPEDASSFIELLSEAETPDEELSCRIVQALNRVFCPKPFDGAKDAFWLWIGHRFHEQPSRCFLANQAIPAREFQVLVPRLPGRLRGAFTYEPDHIVFQYCGASAEPCRLKIDYSLWVTLHSLGRGLPRHFAAERDLNRIDAFLNSLIGTNPPQKRSFFVFNSRDRLVTRVTLTGDYGQYHDVEIS